MVCLVARRKKKSDEETAQRLEGSSKLQSVVSCRRTQRACQGRAWIGGRGGAFDVWANAGGAGAWLSAHRRRGARRSGEADAGGFLGGALAHGPGRTDQDQALGRSVAHQTVSSDGIAVCSLKITRSGVYNALKKKKKKEERQGSGATQPVQISSLELLHRHELEATAGLTRHPFCANTNTSNNSLWSFAVM